MPSPFDHAALQAITTSSGNPWIDALLLTRESLSAPGNERATFYGTTAYKWGGDVGTGVALTYSFIAPDATFSPTYISQYNSSILETPAYVRAAFSSAFQQWSNVANVVFTEVTETSSVVGDVRIGVSASNTNFGPGSMGMEAFAPAWHNSVMAGDIWIAPGSLGTSQYSFDIGERGYTAAIHEIGHAVFNLTDTSYVAGLFAQTLPGSLNYRALTVMSEANVAGTTAGDDLTNVRGLMSSNPTTPMVLDTFVAQWMYGANTTHHTGDDVYVFDDSGTYFETIWDAGGIDTISIVDNSAPGLLDLRPGHYSDVGTTILRYLPSEVLPLKETVGIAYGAIIENAIGGEGNDTIIGNGVANLLVGNSGADIISAAEGNDTLDGGEGDDTLDGGGGSDHLDGGDGNDVIIYDAADDLANVLGGDGIDTLRLINQSVPTTYDLAAHGFENANVVTDDPGGNWWLQISDYYNASWQRTNSDTRADNGNLVQTTFDVSPGGTGVNWQYISDYRNASNVLTNQDGMFDNGGTFAKSYDYAVGTATDGISDELAEFTYFFRNLTDQQNGIVLNVEGFYDDGRKFTQTNDVDGTEAWTFQTNWYETDGTTLDFLEIRWDNGTTQIVPY